MLHYYDRKNDSPFNNLDAWYGVLIVEDKLNGNHSEITKWLNENVSNDVNVVKTNGKVDPTKKETNEYDGYVKHYVKTHKHHQHLSRYGQRLYDLLVKKQKERNRSLLFSLKRKRLADLVVKISNKIDIISDERGTSSWHLQEPQAPEARVRYVGWTFYFSNEDIAIQFKLRWG